MVSVREAHFNTLPFQIDEWVARYIEDKDEAQSLLRLINELESLPVADKTAHQQLLLRAREMIEILAPLNMDIETLQAAILFVVLDADIISLEKIAENYGAPLAKLVSSVVTMDAIGALKVNGHSARTGESQVDNIRKMLLAMVEDVRAVVIKLAERVCLLRLVKNADEETRVLLAREIADIYAPLANRLGIGQLKWELEDISFRYLHPKVYKDIAKQLDGKRLDREVYIDKFVSDLQARLDHDGILAKVYGRPKHIYSIWRKMKGKDLKFDELFDVRAVRIVTDRLQDCYGALGVVHTLWHHIPREFDDYVANPKPNGYQSIHTVVVGPEGKTVEIQIRTEAMHQDAELGVAAHWKYKEGTNTAKQSGYEEKINWLRKILQWQEDVAESGNLVDEVRSQVFEDRVYVFTPNGEVVDLPQGSTVLDFAYYIHSHVGHKCIGAKVDGRIVPFTYQVETGERIEIITSKHPNPKRDWLNPNLGYIKSSRSRSKIQHWFKQQDRDKNIAAGKEMLDAELSRIGLKSKDALIAVERFNLMTMDDMLAAIGGGDLRLNQVVNYTETQIRREPENDDGLLEEIIKKPSAKPKKTGSGQVEVNGVGNLMSHIANCCHPVPGDEIFGYITMGRGISVHRSDCEQVKELMRAHPERSVDVVWGENYSGGYRIKVVVEAHDRSGLLRDVTTVLAAEKSNVMAMSSTSDVKTQTATVSLELELYNLDGLSRILAKLMQIEGVVKARRT
ncbi:GTP diphosphokinase [Shewanella intestini]|uniref:GTP pyrophosphokinase n=1 Tax=Shewanella intestini TaxID=2017544 RepID=A0ABS5HZI4_9GAMM|nr:MULTISPECIES: GTP diphosphokinase [Shewanella]MBR9726520.1 GTP diphosphokinase [Shewanella intestini]MRG34914.1 GTP diphosphokinase [Shewanella sp. XMDDZSB0408]